MKATELREKSAEQLNEHILGLREEQFKQRMKASSGQLTATHEITQLRKDVARAKTVLNEIQGK